MIKAFRSLLLSPRFTSLDSFLLLAFNDVAVSSSLPLFYSAAVSCIHLSSISCALLTSRGVSLFKKKLVFVSLLVSLFRSFVIQYDFFAIFFRLVVLSGELLRTIFCISQVSSARKPLLEPRFFVFIKRSETDLEFLDFESSRALSRRSPVGACGDSMVIKQSARLKVLWRAESINQLLRSFPAIKSTADNPRL